MGKTIDTKAKERREVNKYRERERIESRKKEVR